MSKSVNDLSLEQCLQLDRAAHWYGSNATHGKPDVPVIYVNYPECGLYEYIGQAHIMKSNIDVNELYSIQEVRDAIPGKLKAELFAVIKNGLLQKQTFDELSKSAKELMSKCINTPFYSCINVESLIANHGVALNVVIGSTGEKNMIKQLKPVDLPKNLCWWFHPDFLQIDPLANCNDERGYTDAEWETLQANGNIDICIDTSIGLDEIDPDATGEWKGFNPTPPTPEHFLIAAFDSEHSDNAILWWAKSRDQKDTSNESN